MSIGDLSLIGGRPSLDFINSEGGERNGPPERIRSYADLLAWSLHAGVVETGAAEHLAGVARARPAEAERVFERAIALREALYRIFTAAAVGRAAVDSDRAVLDRELSESLGRRRLVPAGDRYAWVFESGADRLDEPLWPLVEDAAALLTSNRLSRVKKCRGEGCAWLFLDESRNRSRRWCDMGDCGNRAKAKRYRERHGE